MIGEEGADSEVLKLFSIVSLKGADGSTELGGDEGEKGRQGGENIGFTA